MSMGIPWKTGNSNVVSSSGVRTRSVNCFPIRSRLAKFSIWRFENSAFGMVTMVRSSVRTRVERALPDAWQYTTPDRALAARAEAAVLVTYNGRTFDVPVMETRWAFHRLRSPWDELPHLDMLHIARRLWSKKHARELDASPWATTATW